MNTKKIRLQLAGIWIMLLVIYGHLTWVFPSKGLMPTYVNVMIFILAIVSGILANPFEE